MSDAVVATPPAPTTATPAPADIPALESSGGREAFGALDDISKDDGTPEQPPTETRTPEKPAVTPRDDKGKFVKDGDKSKSAAKPAAKPDKTPAKAAPVDFENPPGTIGDLRKHYDALKAHAKELEAKAKDYETKHVELQKKLTEPRDWPEKKTYEEKLSEREKKLQEYEQHLRLTRYEKSQEYKDKYEMPYVNAFMAARDKAASLKVIERKNEEGVITQQSRKGTPEDFDEIFKIRDDDVAADRAVELFGEARAPMILWHREEVQKLQRLGNNAITEMSKKGQEWEKQQQELSQKQMTEAGAMIDNFRNAAVEKYPTLFKEIDGDAKGNELLSKGKHLLDRVLQGGKPLADGEQQMTNEEMAIAIAAVRNKAAGFDRLVYQLRNVQKERDDLKKRLEEFESSQGGPGAAEGGRQATTKPDDGDPFAALDKMARER
jgi:hypothetical protein